MSPSPKQSMKQVSSKLPPALHRRLEAFCAEYELTVSHAVRELISRALDQTNLIEELAAQFELSREENRQLTALLVANLGRSKQLDPSTVPETINATVAYAKARVLEEK